jgi:hypothetical protein
LFESIEKKIIPQGRAQVLTQLAICYMKLRKLDYCEATLDRIAFEADEIVSSFRVKQHTTHLSAGAVGRESDAGMFPLSSSTDSMLRGGSPRKLSTARYHRPSIDNSNKHASVKQLPPQRDYPKSMPSSPEHPPPPLIISASALTQLHLEDQILLLSLFESQMPPRFGE